MTSPPVMPLPYAGPLTRFGVVVDRGDPNVLVIVVPGARWIDQPAWIALGGIVVALALGIGVLMFVRGEAAIVLGLVVLFMALPLLAIGIGGIIGAGAANVKSRTEIRVSRETFTLIVTGPETESFPGREERSWSLEQVGRIKGDLYGMGLTIQIVRQDLLEVLHGHPRNVRRALADLLNDVVREYRERGGRG